MFIKLLCINSTVIQCYDDDFVIKEGDTVNVLVNYEGVRFEYKKNQYSFPYNFSDIENNFISAFDEGKYHKIYKTGHDCKLYLGNDVVIDIKSGTFKTSR